MKRTLMAAAFALSAAGFALPTAASAAALSPGAAGAAVDKANSMIVDVRDRRHSRRGGHAWHRDYDRHRYSRRRNHFGTIVGGIALGALLAGSTYAYAERPPAPGLCWYWADRYERQGYYDYC
jgi:hypothetical protein